MHIYRRKVARASAGVATELSEPLRVSFFFPLPKPPLPDKRLLINKLKAYQNAPR